MEANLTDLHSGPFLTQNTVDLLNGGDDCIISFFFLSYFSNIGYNLAKSLPMYAGCFEKKSTGFCLLKSVVYQGFEIMPILIFLFWNAT